MVRTDVVEFEVLRARDDEDPRAALVAVGEAVRVLAAIRPLDGSVPRLAPARVMEVLEMRNEDEYVVDRATRVVVDKQPSHTSESDILAFGTPL